MTVRRPHILAALLFGTLAIAAPARTIRADAGLTDAMRALYLRMYGPYVPTRTVGDLQEEARNAVASADFDGGGLSRRDIELARATAISAGGADRVRQYFQTDLNRDGLLTFEEYQASLYRGDVQRFYARYEMARRAGEVPPTEVPAEATHDQIIIDTFHAIDADHDNRLSLFEVFRYDEQRIPYRPARLPVEAEKYLVLDSDGDGAVTMAEVDSTSAAFLAEQAQAGAGPRQVGAAEEEERGRPQLVDAVRCPAPRPSANARVVRMGVREGAQLSSIALGSQDEPTYAVSVEIEPGDTPLYIVATSNSATLWRLTGATGRVEAFVGSSQVRDSHAMWPAVGVTGLSRVRFHTAPYGCFGDVDERSMISSAMRAEASQLLQRRIGRPIDVLFGAYQPKGVRLPSAQAFQVAAETPGFFRTLHNEAAAARWREFLGYFPGGIATPDLRQIVSRNALVPYEVQSYAAGLAQLLEEGAIVPLSNSFANFEIRRRFRFPAGLAGGHLAWFSLPDGVPVPIGEPAHSKVISASEPHLCLLNCY